MPRLMLYNTHNLNDENTAMNIENIHQFCSNANKFMKVRVRTEVINAFQLSLKVLKIKCRGHLR